MLTLATRALIATTAIQMVAACAALTVPAIAPVVAADLGVPASMVGTYISLLYVGASTAALVGGTAVLRVGPLRLSQVCLVLCAVGLVAAMLAPGIASALGIALVAASAVVIGCGYGPITPASSHVLARTTPPDKLGMTFSIKQTGVPAGTALAGVVVPPLTIALGWPFALGTIAAVCIVVALTAQPLRAPLDDDRDRTARFSMATVTGGIALVLRSPPLAMMAFVSFVYAGMQMSVSGFIVAYLHTELSIGLVAAGTALTVSNVAGVVARIVWGGISDRTGSPRVTLALIGFLMSAGAVAAALFSPAWPMSAILFVSAVLGATAIGWNGVYLAEVARLAPPGQAARATGACLFFTFVGVVINPFVFGWAQRATGSYVVSYLGGAVAAALVGVLLLVRKPREK